VVERDSFLVVLLAGFDESQMRVGLRIGRVRFGNSPPRSFRFSILSLLLESDCRLPLVFGRQFGLYQTRGRDEPSPFRWLSE
jgi:hypothetical protein